MAGWIDPDAITKWLEEEKQKLANWYQGVTAPAAAAPVSPVRRGLPMQDEPRPVPGQNYEPVTSRAVPQGRTTLENQYQTALPTANIPVNIPARTSDYSIYGQQIREKQTPPTRRGMARTGEPDIIPVEIPDYQQRPAYYPHLAGDLPPIREPELPPEPEEPQREVSRMDQYMFPKEYFEPGSVLEERMPGLTIGEWYKQSPAYWYGQQQITEQFDRWRDMDDQSPLSRAVTGAVQGAIEGYGKPMGGVVGALGGAGQGLLAGWLGDPAISPAAEAAAHGAMEVLGGDVWAEEPLRDVAQGLFTTQGFPRERGTGLAEIQLPFGTLDTSDKFWLDKSIGEYAAAYGGTLAESVRPEEWSEQFDVEGKPKPAPVVPSAWWEIVSQDYIPPQPTVFSEAMEDARQYISDLIPDPVKQGVSDLIKYSYAIADPASQYIQGVQERQEGRLNRFREYEDAQRQVHERIAALPPEQQAIGQMAFAIGTSGPFRQMEFLDLVLGRPQQLQELANQRDQEKIAAQEAYAAGNMEASALHSYNSGVAGREYARLNNLTVTDMLMQVENPWAVLARGVFLDPLNLLDKPITGAVKGYRAWRAARKYNVTPEAAESTLESLLPYTERVLEAFGTGESELTGSGAKYLRRLAGMDEGTKLPESLEKFGDWLFSDFARTPQSRADLDTNVLWRSTQAVLRPPASTAQPLTKTGILQVLDYWTDSAKRPQMVGGILVDGQIRIWPAGVLANSDVVPRLPILDVIRPQLMEYKDGVLTPLLKSLQGDDPLNMAHFMAELNGYIQQGARQLEGVPGRVAGLPYGTANVKVLERPGGTSVLQYVDEKGKVLYTGAERPSAETKRLYDEMQEQMAKGVKLADLPRLLLQTSADVQRAFMADMFLGLSPRNWIRNAMGATTMALSSDTHTTMPLAKVLEQIEKWHGYMPEQYMEAAYRGIKRPLGELPAQQATGSGLLGRIPVLKPIMEKAYSIPYGYTEIPIGFGRKIPFGEEAHRIKQHYVAELRTLQKNWETFLYKEILPELEAMGIEQPIRNNLIQHLYTDAMENGLSGIQYARDYVSANTWHNGLGVLRIDPEVLPPFYQNEINRLLNQFTGGDQTQLVKDIKAVFELAEKPIGHILRMSGSAYKPIWVDQEVALDAEGIIDNLLDAAKRAGIDPAEAERQARATAEAWAGSSEEAYSRFRNEMLHMGDSEDAWNVVTDFWWEMYGLKSQSYKSSDKAARMAVDAGNTNAAWELAFKEKAAAWELYGSQFMEASDRYRAILQRVTAGDSYNAHFSWSDALEKWARIDFDELKQVMNTPLGGMDPAQAKLWQEVIDSNRVYVDNAATQLFEVWRRYPTQENYDILVETMRQTGLMGQQVRAFLDEELARLAVDDTGRLGRNYKIYHEIRNTAWEQYFQYAVPDTLYGAAKAMVVNATAGDLTTNLRWTDAFTGGNFQLLGPAAREGYWEVRNLADNTYRVFMGEDLAKGQVAVSADSVPVQVIDDYRRLVGESVDTPSVVQAADEVMAEVQQAANAQHPVDPAYLQNQAARASAPYEPGEINYWGATIRPEMRGAGEVIEDLTPTRIPEPIRGAGEVVEDLQPTRVRQPYEKPVMAETSPEVWEAAGGQRGRRIATGYEDIGRRPAPEVTQPAARPAGPEVTQPTAPPAAAVTPLTKGQRYYRATTPGETKRIRTGNEEWDSYFFVADTPRAASPYGDVTEEITLSPDAKILREGTTEFRKTVGQQRKGESLFDFVTRAAQRARESGYDGIHFLRQSDVGTAIWNREIVQGAQAPIPTPARAAAAVTPPEAPAAPSFGVGTRVETPSGPGTIYSENKRGWGVELDKGGKRTFADRNLKLETKARVQTGAEKIPRVEPQTGEDLPLLSGTTYGEPPARRRPYPQSGRKRTQIRDYREPGIYTGADDARARIAELEDARKTMREAWDQVAVGEVGLGGIDTYTNIYGRGGDINMSLNKGDVTAFEDLYGTVILGRRIENYDDVASILQEYKDLYRQIQEYTNALEDAGQFNKMSGPEIVKTVRESLVAIGMTNQDIARLALESRRDILDFVQGIPGFAPTRLRGYDEMGMHYYEFTVPNAVEMMGLDTKEPIWQAIWKRIQASRNGPIDDRVADLNKWHIHALDEAEDTILRSLDTLLQPMDNRMSGSQRLRMQDLIDDRIAKRWEQELAIANEVGQKTANWNMLNFSDKRNIDTAMSMVSPFPYFWSRMPSRLALAALMKPSLVNFFYEQQKATRLENVQSQVPAHRRGTLPVPGVPDARIRNPMEYFVPFGMYFSPNPFVESVDADNDTEKWIRNLHATVPGLLPAYDWALRKHYYGEDPNFQFANLMPIPRLWGYLGMATGYGVTKPGQIRGPIGTGRSVLALGDVWDYGRVGKELALMVMDGDITPELAYWAMDIGYQIQQQTGPLPSEPAKARPIWEEAVRRMGIHRGVALLSGFVTGVPIYYYSSIEHNMRMEKQNRYQLRYSTEGQFPGQVGNIGGGETAIREYDRQTGDVLDPAYGYQGAYPGSEIGYQGATRPAYRAQELKHKEAKDAIYDAERDNIEQYLADHPEAQTNANARRAFSDHKDQLRSEREEQLAQLETQFPERQYGDSAALPEEERQMQGRGAYDPLARANPDEVRIEAQAQAKRQAEDEIPYPEDGTGDQIDAWNAAVNARMAEILNDPAQASALVGGRTFEESPVADAAQRLGLPDVQPPLAPSDVTPESAAGIRKGISDQYKAPAEVEFWRKWDEQWAASEAEWVGRKQDVSAQFGPEIGNLYEQYLSLPKGKARENFKAQNPELRAVSLYTWHPEEYRYLQETFGENSVLEWARRPAWEDTDEARAARGAYFDAHPAAFLVNSWLYGRPSADNDEVSDDTAFQYNFGKDYNEAEKRWPGIWQLVEQYKRGWDKRTKAAFFEANPQVSDFFDWWYANLPDTYNASTRSSGYYGYRSYGRSYGGYSSGGGSGGGEYSVDYGIPKIDVPGLSRELQVQIDRNRRWKSAPQTQYPQRIEFWRPQIPRA